MKRILLAMTVLIAAAALVACGSTTTTTEAFDASMSINVYTRDTTSGTRAGFMAGIGFAEAETDDSVLADGFIIKDNTGILTAMTIDEYGIGYISLSSVNTSVKGLYYNGVAPTEANVINNTYALKRPFMWMTRAAGDYPSDTVEAIVNAFVAFLGTTDAGDIIANAGAISLPSSTTWDSIKAQHDVCVEDNSGVTVRFGGSDSIQKVAQALTAAFMPKCGNFVAEHDHTGSGDAYKRTNDPAIKDTSVGKDVAFASRLFKSTETVPESQIGQLAWDAIVAIVHLSNPLSDVTAADLKAIYDGTSAKWSDVAAGE
ncbi:MAG: substrate-binding domain-containing protein [Candidatus Izemoplasmatales bacterium]